MTIIYSRILMLILLIGGPTLLCSLETPTFFNGLNYTGDDEGCTSGPPTQDPNEDKGLGRVINYTSSL